MFDVENKWGEKQVKNTEGWIKFRRERVYCYKKEIGWRDSVMTKHTAVYKDTHILGNVYWEKVLIILETKMYAWQQIKIHPFV